MMQSGNIGDGGLLGLSRLQQVRSAAFGLGAGGVSRAQPTVGGGDSFVSSASPADIGGLVQRIQSLLGEAKSSGIAAVQREIDATIQTIDRIQAGDRGNNFTLGKTIEGLEESSFFVPFELDAGDRIDVDVEITQSAQQGALYLSFGGEQLDLGGATEAFSLVIEGNGTPRVLQFSSGQSLAQVAVALNTVSDETGITATTSATGIFLTSSELGVNELVSVRMLSDGGIGNKAGQGIYRMDADDQNTIDASSRAGFGSADALNGVRDFGQDIQGTIFGEPALSYGTTLVSPFQNDSPYALLRFDAGRAQQTGSFIAAQLLGPPGGPLTGAG